MFSSHPPKGGRTYHFAPGAAPASEALSSSGGQVLGLVRTLRPPPRGWGTLTLLSPRLV